MRVILAQPRGFCAGVVRAIDIVERALHKHGAPVYVRHEIVHNRHVVDSLKQQGARFVEELSEVPPSAVTIFSAHGVGKTVEAQARERRLEVFDATCPLVSKVHKQGKQYAAAGRRLILIGHAGHPEVVGTMDQIPGEVLLVESAAEVDMLDLPADTPLAYVTQTTLSVDDTRAIIDALKRRFSNLLGPNAGDICYATQNRQNAARELSRQVDVLLVVGSQNSSNARRLCEIAKDSGIPGYLIAQGSELRAEWVRNAAAVGITAGASTPESMVQDVVDALRKLGAVELSVLPGLEEKVMFRLPSGLADAGNPRDTNEPDHAAPR